MLMNFKKNGVGVAVTLLFLSFFSIISFTLSQTLLRNTSDNRISAQTAACNANPWDWNKDGKPDGACGPENDPQFGIGKCAQRNADPDGGKWFLCKKNPADGDLDWYGPCNSQTECLTQSSVTASNTPTPNTTAPSATPGPNSPTLTVTPLPSVTPGGPTPTIDPVVCIGEDSPCSRDGFNKVAAIANQDASYLNRFQTACNYLGFCANLATTCTNYNPLTPTPTAFACSIVPTVVIPTLIPTGNPTETPTPTGTSNNPWVSLDIASNSPLTISHYMNQCSSPWKDVKVDPAQCTNSTICSIGCGQTDVAMILSQTSTSVITPDTVSAWYRNNSLRQCGTSVRYAGTQGLDPDDLIRIFPSYGKQAQMIAFSNSGRGTAVQDVQIQKQFKEQMVNYLNAGWTVIANTTQFSTDHEVIISQITADGDVIVYDPHSTASQPAHMEGLGTLNGLFEIGFVIVK